MKQTRQITIRDRIFTMSDLQRVAALFEKQPRSAEESNRFDSLKFLIRFSDDTSTESDSSNILTDSVVLGPARPVDIRFSFHNYSLDLHLTFEIRHGDGTYGNVATIAAPDSTWVNDNFVALKESIDTAKPQTFWFRRHPTILLNLIALGVGSLIQLVITVFIDLFVAWSGASNLIPPLSETWRAIIVKFLPLLIIFQWLSRWLVGFGFAFDIRNWLFRLWPNIELDIGTEHLKTEKLQRNRLVAVITLIVLPIITSIIYDVLRYFGHAF